MEKVNHIPKHIKSSVMTSKATFTFGSMALLVWLVVSQQAIAQKTPAGVFAFRPEGYAFADYPDAFDNAQGDGITVEAWFQLTDFPKDGERWVLIAKPGSYSVILYGRNRHNRTDPEGIVYLEYSVFAQRNTAGSTAGSRIIPFLPRTFPLNQPVHIAAEMRGAGPVVIALFLDQQMLSIGERGKPMGRSNTSLLLGGTKTLNLLPLAIGYSSIEGWVDEVRISNVIRYPFNQGQIAPARRFRTDKHTIALWHFDEGRGAFHYADASGNGYTLFAGGSLGVDARGKLATTWGSLKRRNEYTNP